MKRISSYVLLVVLAVCGSLHAAPPLDSYGGVTAVNCTNPNGAKYFGLSSIGKHLVLCDPAGHPFFGRGVFVIDQSSGGNDESGGNYNSFTTTKFGATNTEYTWADQELNRMASWGFNMTSAESSGYITPFWSWVPSGTNPVKKPFIESLEVCGDAWINDGALLSQAPKDALDGLSAQPRDINIGYYSGITDYEDPNWTTFVNAAVGTGNASYQQGQLINASASDKSYLVAFNLCDSDYLHGFEAGPDYDMTPSEAADPRLSYLVATDSPVSWASSRQKQLYSDSTLYAKKTWYTQLTGEYSTIAALNTAWGSSYTTFGTSGTCYGTHWPSWICPSPQAATVIGSGNGSNLTFSTTLSTPIAQKSLAIFVGSTLAGGDAIQSISVNSSFVTQTTYGIYGPSQTQPTVANVGTAGTSSWSYEVVAVLVPPSGPTIVLRASPLGTTSTGNLTLSATNYNTITTSNTADGGATCEIYRTSVPAGGSPSTTGLIGSTYCGGTFSDTAKTGDGTTAPATTQGQIQSASINYSTGAVSVTFQPGTAPLTGTNVTAEYIANGWGLGTGVMDEDGRSAHQTWTGHNVICPDGVGTTLNCVNEGGGTPYASSGMVSDLNTLDTTLAAKYGSVTTNAINATFPGAINAGGIVLGAKGVPPNRYVLAGLKGYVNLDVLANNGSVTSSGVLSQAELDFMHQYMGDIALGYASYYTSNFDSPYAWPNSSCTGSGTAVTCTVASPNLFQSDAPNYYFMTSCADASYNVGSVRLTANSATSVSYTAAGNVNTGSTTCNIAYSGANVPDLSSQAARATQVSGDYNLLFNKSYSADGVEPYVMLEWWQWSDHQGERLNWGLVDQRDNAYNGKETTTAVVACQSPIQAYSCGGELRSGWGSDDGITPVANANFGIDAALAGLASPANLPTLQGGAISNGAIK